MGRGVTALTNGNYVVGSGGSWANGALASAGAVALLDGSAPTSGVISPSNAIIGTRANSYLDFYYYDAVNDRIFVVDYHDTAQLYSLSSTLTTLNDYKNFADSAGSSITLAPSFLTATLNAGTNVTLQASNDITLTDALSVNNSTGNGGNLTLQAGRSILLNNSLTTDNGNLTLLANTRLATGVVDSQRDAGNAVIAMGAGASIDAGNGDVSILLDDGAGKINRSAGDIRLRDITANSILARNANNSGDVVLESGALTSNAGSGDSLILASKRNIINNAGVGALQPSGSGRWLLYSTDPAADTLAGLSPSFTRYGCLYGSTCPALGIGNGLLYSIRDPAAPLIPSSTTTRLPDSVLYRMQGRIPKRDTALAETSLMPETMHDQRPTTFLTEPAASPRHTLGQSILDGWITVDPALIRQFALDRMQI